MPLTNLKQTLFNKSTQQNETVNKTENQDNTMTEQQDNQGGDEVVTTTIPAKKEVIQVVDNSHTSLSRDLRKAQKELEKYKAELAKATEALTTSRTRSRQARIDSVFAKHESLVHKPEVFKKLIVDDLDFDEETGRVFNKGNPEQDVDEYVTEFLKENDYLLKPTITQAGSGAGKSQTPKTPVVVKGNGAVPTTSQELTDHVRKLFTVQNRS